MKILKIAFGSALAIIFANLLGLEYSTAAGIITLLTIQDTAKETIVVSMKRILAFVIATFLSLVIFNLVGYHAISFGVFLLLFVWSCYTFQLKDAIAMNAVLTTHYLLAGNITVSLIFNEFGLLLIGAFLGTLLNLFMPNDEKHIKQTQDVLEEDLRKVLARMSEYIVKESKADYNGTCFVVLEEHIQNGIQYAYSNMNNKFLQETQYFMDYMQMRKQQCQVLKNIYDKIIALKDIPMQTEEIATFINHISTSLHETNNAKELLDECNDLFLKFQESKLPSTRSEFESRAVLYMLLKDFEYFLKIKESFVQSLSEKQKNLYWNHD
jgi:uncharacterized membrane protein YgaE (UPF0421/DUF939 family)